MSIKSHTLNVDVNWVTIDPTAPGFYSWRKNWQWEPVTREVRVREEDGVLITYSNRYVQWLPLNRVGGEWQTVDGRPTPRPKFLHVKQ
jgi:hypothetical protein